MLGFALIAAELLAAAGLVLDFGFRKARMNTDTFDLGGNARRFALVNSSQFDNFSAEIARLLEREYALSGRVAALETRIAMPASFLRPAADV